VSQKPPTSRAKVEKDQESTQAAIGRLIKNMHLSTRQAIDESLRRERVNLSFAHFVALYTLSTESGVAGAELARRAFVTAQTMNTILHRLEKDGSIERRPNPSNQRADSWSITKSGQIQMGRARVVAERVWTQVFDAFSEHEVRQLQRLLERCLAGLDKQVGLRATKASTSKKRTKQRA
jgi:DNA-binding MarR family transcriptional regulator